MSRIKIQIKIIFNKIARKKLKKYPLIAKFHFLYGSIYIQKENLIFEKKIYFLIRIELKYNIEGTNARNMNHILYLL